VAAYEEGIGIAVMAFRAGGALSKTIWLSFGELLGTALLNQAATQQFTHGRDLARANRRSAALDPGSVGGLPSHARFAVADAYRRLDGQALSGSAREAPAGAGLADRLAAFLGRTGVSRAR
jgi:hypothetical protein